MKETVYLHVFPTAYTVRNKKVLAACRHRKFLFIKKMPILFINLFILL